MTGRRAAESYRLRQSVPPRACTARGDVRVATARIVLAAHRISTETARCRVCQRSCPCDDANEAANLLAGGGLPLVDPGTPEPAGARSWLDRLVAWCVAGLRWPVD